MSQSYDSPYLIKTWQKVVFEKNAHAAVAQNFDVK